LALLQELTILMDCKLACEYRDVALRAEHLAVSRKTREEVELLLDMLEAVAEPVLVIRVKSGDMYPFPVFERSVARYVGRGMQCMCCHGINRHRMNPVPRQTCYLHHAKALNTARVDSLQNHRCRMREVGFNRHARIVPM
jgi:hypothetical protein